MGTWRAVRKATGAGWKELERESGTGWKALEWGYEDFTTFTEVDTGNNRVQKTANHVDHYATRNEDTYLYKDYGVAHFGNFTHKIKWKATSSASAMLMCWVLANALNDVAGLTANNDNHIRLNAYVNALRLYESHSGTEYWTAAFTYTNNTWYYIKIVKNGTALNAYVYSDSGYSNLLHTFSLTLHSDQTNRYLYACDTYNDGNNYGMSQDVENFDLG